MVFKNAGNGTTINFEVQGIEQVINGAIVSDKKSYSIYLKMHREKENALFCIYIKFMGLNRKMHNETICLDYKLSDNRILKPEFKALIA